MSTLETLGIFVGLPIALFVIIAVLVAAPSWTRGSKAGSGSSWWAEPQWFGTVAKSATARPDGTDGTDGTDGAVADEPSEAHEDGEHVPGGVGARW